MTGEGLQMRALLGALLAFAGCAWLHPALSRDLSLDEAERLVLAKNRTVVAAQRDAEIAAAQITSAGALPNPVLALETGRYSFSRNGPSASETAESVVRAEQLIERGGKRELRVDAARRLEAAAREDTVNTIRQQLEQLRTAYYALKSAQERATLLAEQERLFERLFDAARVRLKAGDLAAADVAKVEVDVARARIDAREAFAERTRAQVALALLIAEEATATELRATDAWPATAPPPGVPDESVLDARPDIRGARARVEAADRLRELARSQRVADVTVAVRAERFPGFNGIAYGVGVSFPLLAFYDYSGEIRRAEVERYAAIDALEKARADALSELIQTQSDLAAATARLERYVTAVVPSAAKVAEAAEFAFARGGSSVLEVLDARRTFRSVRLEALDAQSSHAKALAAWRAARATADTLPKGPAETNR